jgi:hypothetical protein
VDIFLCDIMLSLSCVFCIIKSMCLKTAAFTFIPVCTCILLDVIDVICIEFVCNLMQFFVLSAMK